jgi:hypothetical protein
VEDVAVVVAGGPERWGSAERAERQAAPIEVAA